MIAALFLGLFILQYLDLHSTLTASASQYETNPLLLRMSHSMPLISALFVVKGISFLALALLRRAWCGGGHGDDLLWLSFVGFAFAVMLVIVASNYLAR